jgi:hypothetical protein
MFWTDVLITLVIWYGLAFLFVRLRFDSGESAFTAVRRGPWLAMVITAVVTGVGSWFIWQQWPLTGALAMLSIVLPTIILLVLMAAEPAQE